MTSQQINDLEFACKMLHDRVTKLELVINLIIIHLHVENESLKDIFKIVNIKEKSTIIKPNLVPNGIKN